MAKNVCNLNVIKENNLELQELQIFKKINFIIVAFATEKIKT